MLDAVKTITDVFFRKRFYQHDFFCGSNTWQEVKNVVCHILLRHPLVKGVYIGEYEKLAAQWMNCQYGCSFATGRQALYAILKALGIGEGDEVILQAFTCVVVPRAILYAGAKPVYVDIDGETYNMDAAKVRAALTPRTRALIMQHTFGYPAAVRELQDICVENSLYLIEDCAHAVGSRYNGVNVGGFGTAGFYSSDHTKTISTSTGGMAFTNDKTLAEKIQLCGRDNTLSRLDVLRIALTFVVETLITYPQVYWLLKPLRQLLNRTLFFFYKDENAEQKPLRYPLKLSNLQAMIGLDQLSKLASNLGHRMAMSNWLGENENQPLLRYPRYNGNPQLLVDAMCKYVTIGRWYDSPVFGCERLDSVGYKKGSCPVAELVAKHVVNFPTHSRTNTKMFNFLEGFHG